MEEKPATPTDSADASEETESLLPDLPAPEVAPAASAEVETSIEKPGEDGETEPAVVAAVRPDLDQEPDYEPRTDLEAEGDEEVVDAIDAAVAETVAAKPAEVQTEPPSDGEPKPALPMQKTNPTWARTAPPSDEQEEGVKSEAAAAEPAPPVPMQKAAPEWAKTVSGTEPPEEAAEAATGTEPTIEATTEPPVPMPKTAPAWAQTAQAADEVEIPVEAEPVAAAKPVEPVTPSWDATPTPAAAGAQAWPPDPPTERAMPAWTPGGAAATGPDEWPPEPATEHAMPVWSPSDSVPADTAPAAPVSSAHAAEVLPAERAIPMSTSTPPPASPAPTVAAAAAPAPAAEPAPAPAAPAAPTPPAPPAPPAPRDPSVDWPGAVDVPSWAPRLGTEWVSAPEPQAAPQPAPQPAAPQPAPAAQSPAPAAASQPSPAPAAPAAQPPAAPGQQGSSWQVVPAKQFEVKISGSEPNAEDRAYAEWFAWAKRGGAKAPACHAAAQGAFAALSAGHDVATAVRWATAAMANPPVAVAAARQTYCAWFALAHIDLSLDGPRAHRFATAAVRALDSGADARAAHLAGAAAAGIR